MEPTLEVPKPANGMEPIDSSTPEWRANHYAVLARYRKHDPLHPAPVTAQLSGRSFTEWHVTRYDDIAFILKDKRFVREVQTVYPDMPLFVSEKWPLVHESQRNWMLMLDPPNHTRLRRLVSLAFTPKMVENLRGRIESISQQLLSELAQEPSSSSPMGNTGVDIVPGYAFALPVTVIAELLGVPSEDRPLFRKWSYLIARTLDSAPEEEYIAANAAIRDLRDYLKQIVAEREQNPKSDLISGLIAARDDEGKLSELELIDNCILLLVAGHETTVNLIANGLYLLATHEAARQQLLSNPAITPSAVEEVLRFEGSVQVTQRMASEDVTIRDRIIRRGDVVTTWLAAANRDPEVFTNPDTFDVTRHPNRHQTFGGGIHFCLGAPLARLEGEIALASFLSRYPTYQFVDAGPTWIPATTFRTLKSLHLHLS